MHNVPKILICSKIVHEHQPKMLRIGTKIGTVGFVKTNNFLRLRTVLIRYCIILLVSCTLYNLIKCIQTVKIRYCIILLVFSPHIKIRIKQTDIITICVYTVFSFFVTHFIIHVRKMEIKLL